MGGHLLPSKTVLIVLVIFGWLGVRLAVTCDGRREQENVRSVEAEAEGNADYLFTVQYSDC